MRVIVKIYRSNTKLKVLCMRFGEIGYQSPSAGRR